VPLCFPDESINEDATNLGHPISNHGNDIFGKGGDPQ
jgi:hypothetical protein